MLFGAAPQISPLLLGSRRQPLSEIRSVLWLRVRRAGSAASSLFHTGAAGRCGPIQKPRTRRRVLGPLAAFSRRRRLASRGGRGLIANRLFLVCYKAASFDLCLTCAGYY